MSFFSKLFGSKQGPGDDASRPRHPARSVDVPPIVIGDFFESIADIDTKAPQWIEAIAHALCEQEPPIQTHEEAQRFCRDEALRIDVPAFCITQIATYALNLASHTNRQESLGQ